MANVHGYSCHTQLVHIHVGHGMLEFLRRVGVYSLVTFHRKQKSFERVLVSPILDFGAPGGFRIRYSYFTLAPYQRPFAEMEAWYRAYNRFARLVRDERHQYRFLLQAGDFLIYDNWRMLHARTAFTGARWVRGVYFDSHPQPT